MEKNRYPLQCSVGVAVLRERRLRRAAASQGRLGSPFRVTLPPVRSSAGDWGNEHYFFFFFFFFLFMGSDRAAVILTPDQRVRVFISFDVGGVG